MIDFCSVDRRLLPTLYVPLADFDASAAMAREAIEMGAAALLVPSACPKGHSPSHLGLDPVWAAAQDAGIPVVFHVGGEGDHFNHDYFLNGLPIPPDFHGGEENFRSVDYMGIPHPVMLTMATMIFDGVLDRFPRLRLGAIELGAVWIPSWIHQMESAFEAFARHEERLRALELRPTEYVQRQIRATPYPTDDVGWLTEQLGPDICLFSSDYPHVEGGRKPFERFERSLGDASDAVRQRFYHDNFVDLMGERVLDLGLRSVGCSDDRRPRSEAGGAVAVVDHDHVGDRLGARRRLDDAALDGVAERDQLMVVRRRALDLDGLRAGRRLDDELASQLRRDRVGHEHPAVAPEHVEAQDAWACPPGRSSSIDPAGDARLPTQLGRHPSVDLGHQTLGLGRHDRWLGADSPARPSSPDSSRCPSSRRRRS